MTGRQHVPPANRNRNSKRKLSGGSTPLKNWGSTASAKGEGIIRAYRRRPPEQREGRSKTRRGRIYGTVQIVPCGDWRAEGVVFTTGDGKGHSNKGDPTASMKIT